jgi:hypothetical protein
VPLVRCHEQEQPPSRPVMPPPHRKGKGTTVLRYESFLSFCRRRGRLSPLLSGEAIAAALEGLRLHVQRPYQIVEREELGAMLDAAAADSYDAPAPWRSSL